MNLSLGGTDSSPSRVPKHTLSPQKVKREQTQLISKHAVWSVWDGNRILQDYNGRHVFTTVYEADSFVPLARVIWLDEQLSRAANDAPNAEQLETLNNLQQLTLSNLEGFESLDADAFKLPHAQNDEVDEHSSHQIYWYQNDHLGTPRELTEQGGEIAWEAVYQAWGNTVTVEWEERAQPNPIQLNTLEQMYLLQPHRFQGQIYDVETGLHYNRFRYYDPDCRRFISHDPIGLLGGDNHFQYAPNPVEWVDPWGLSRKTCKDGEGTDISLSDLGVPDSTFKPKADITKPFVRLGPPTKAQRDSISGKNCVRCGAKATIPDHILALVVEYYATGKNDMDIQNSIDAIQPHCNKCSLSQGGKLAAFSKRMKKLLGL